MRLNCAGDTINQLEEKQIENKKSNMNEYFLNLFTESKQYTEQSEESKHKTMNMKFFWLFLRRINREFVALTREVTYILELIDLQQNELIRSKLLCDLNVRSLRLYRTLSPKW